MDKSFLGEILLPLSLFSLSIFCLFHHYLITGGMWFDPKDYHHEDLVVTLLILGMVEVARIILDKVKKNG